MEPQFIAFLVTLTGVLLVGFRINNQGNKNLIDGQQKIIDSLALRVKTVEDDKNKLDEESKEDKERLRKRLEKFEQELKDALAELAKAEGIISQSYKQNTMLIKTIEDTNQKLGGREQKINELAEKVEDLKKDLKARNAELSAVIVERNTLKQQIENSRMDLQKELDTTKAELQAIKENLPVIVAVPTTPTESDGL